MIRAHRPSRFVRLPQTLRNFKSEFVPRRRRLEILLLARRLPAHRRLALNAFQRLRLAVRRREITRATERHSIIRVDEARRVLLARVLVDRRVPRPRRQLRRRSHRRHVQILPIASSRRDVVRALRLASRAVDRRAAQHFSVESSLRLRRRRRRRRRRRDRTAVASRPFARETRRSSDRPSRAVARVARWCRCRARATPTLNTFFTFDCEKRSTRHTTTRDDARERA